jgi:hypothetical protein
MMAYRTLGADAPDEWIGVLEQVGVRDVFFRPEYLRLCEGICDGVAECFVYEHGDSMAAYPYLRRRIGDTGWFDITSAYGFGGSVHRSPGGEPAGFDDAFREHCRASGVISEFVRFHPLYPSPQHPGQDDLQEWTNRPVVFVDFTAPGFSLDASVKRDVRKNVAKALRNGVAASVDVTGRHVAVFADLYRATMERKQASAFYFLNEAFLDGIGPALGFGRQAMLCVAEYQGRVVAGLLVLCGDRFAYNYLSGSDPEFNRFGVNDLVQYTALHWAKDRGFEGMLLGGGQSEDDSLLRYKARFGPADRAFVTGARIHDPGPYRDLSAPEGIRTDRDPAFFPLYRSPTLEE